MFIRQQDRGRRACYRVEYMCHNNYEETPV